jgi:membrane-bound lytic murein transglycosylase D
MAIWMQRFSFFMAGVLSMLLFISYSTTPGEVKIRPNAYTPQHIRSIELKEKYSFAGEWLPIQNFDVRERLERELSVNAYWHSNTVLCIKAAQRYFPIIEKALREYNIPEDFKYIPVIETSLRNETSPAGARGIWQFMKPVAEQYKLEVSEEVDERYHFEKATQAACQHILRYKQRFGSWTLAAAAYNAGEGNIHKELQRQGEDSYYDMNVNDETSRYLFRLVAMKEIIEHPEEYGFFIQPDEKFKAIPTRKIEVKQSIPNLGEWARTNGTSYRMLKSLNPWLRGATLTQRPGKNYWIEIPR